MFDTNEILDKIDYLQCITKDANTNLKKMLTVKRMLADAKTDFQDALQNGPAVEIDKSGIRLLSLIDALDLQIFNFADSYSYMEDKIFNLDMNIPVTPRIVKGGSQ